MQIVIDIREKDYQLMKDGHIPFNMLDTIMKGTPLDKIRAEIERQEKWLWQAGYTAYNVDIALDAIKKAVIAESEDAECSTKH